MSKRLRVMSRKPDSDVVKREGADESVPSQLCWCQRTSSGDLVLSEMCGTVEVELE